jgi:hypothetical protein
MAKAVLVVEYDVIDEHSPREMQRAFAQALSVVPPDCEGVMRRSVFLAIEEDADKVLKVFEGFIKDRE